MRDRGEFVSRGNRFRSVSRIFDYPLLRWPFGGNSLLGNIYIYIYITRLVSDVGRTEPQRQEVVLSQQE